MNFNSIWMILIAGILCGVISGFGIGGGTVLMIWLTAVVAMDQKLAQGINLLYFIPTSLGALIIHIKNKMICLQAVIPAAICGCIAAGLTAWFSASLDVSFLRKLFGGFLLVVGALEFFKKRPKARGK